MTRILLALSILHFPFPIPAPAVDFPAVASLAIGTNEVAAIDIPGLGRVWERPNPIPYDEEVAYIESTGTQWIDTGTTINTVTDEVRVSCQLIGTTAYKYLFGVMQAGAYFGVGRDNSNTYLLYASGATSKALSFVTGSRHEILANSSGLSIDGTTMFRYSSFASTAPVYLFNLNRPGNSNNYKSSSRLWSYRHYRAGALVRDFIPVRSGSEYCLYDRVSGALFHNAGSGVFLGPP